MKYHNLILGGAVAVALFSGCAGVTQPKKDHIHNPWAEFDDYRRRVTKEYTLDAYQLAAKAFAFRSDTFRIVGETKYECSYNGIEPDGCEYAGVKKTLSGTQEIYNFRYCKGIGVDFIGKTGAEERLTKEAKEQFHTSRQEFDTICKRQGQARIQIGRFTFKCFFFPRDPYDRQSTDFYKWVVLKWGEMIQ